MKLALCKLPDTVEGIYKVKGVAGRMPERARYLYPDAARSFMEDLQPHVVVSDMFRSAESSLAAVQSGRGAKRPGYSGHNYGLSIDIDINATWSRTGGPRSRLNKKQLDEWMAILGWYCHRRDHLLKSEGWHYNFLAGGYEPMPDTAGYSTATDVEARILDLHWTDFDLDNVGAQTALHTLKLYHGDIDGIMGPLSREAIRVFQRAWGIRDSGRIDPETARTLAYVSAEKQLVDL